METALLILAVWFFVMILLALVAGAVARFGGAAEDELTVRLREEAELANLTTRPRMMA